MEIDPERLRTSRRKERQGAKRKTTQANLLRSRWNQSANEGLNIWQENNLGQGGGIAGHMDNSQNGPPSQRYLNKEIACKTQILRAPLPRRIGRSAHWLATFFDSLGGRGGIHGLPFFDPYLHSGTFLRGGHFENCPKKTANFRFSQVLALTFAPFFLAPSRFRSLRFVVSHSAEPPRQFFVLLKKKAEIWSEDLGKRWILYRKHALRSPPFPH